jgi:hypothetical protein
LPVSNDKEALAVAPDSATKAEPLPTKKLPSVTAAFDTLSNFAL